MLQQTSFLCRKVMPHGNTGAVVGIPADVRRDVDVEPGDSVDLDYDRESETLTIHFKDD